MNATDRIKVDHIELTVAGSKAAESGLLGWLRFRVNRTLVIDGVALRKTLSGKHVLSFPAKRDRAGRQRFFVRPLDDDSRRDIEAQVLESLGIAA